MDVPRFLSVDDLTTPEQWEAAMKIEVYLDGVKQDRCTAYDLDAGTVARYRLDHDGKPVMVKNAAGEIVWAIELVKGEVACRLREKGT